MYMYMYSVSSQSMLLLYKLLYLTYFHYSLYLPMMRRERKRSAYLTVCIASVLTPFFRNWIRLQFSCPFFMIQFDGLSVMTPSPIGETSRVGGEGLQATGQRQSKIGDSSVDMSGCGPVTMVTVRFLA